MKPVIEKETCIGCGVCESVCPEVFKMMDDGKADAIKTSGYDESAVKDAIDQCPVQAISLK
ncbi:MAG: ferredoxin [bacterium]|nr:ferredoxin [bacterium]